MVFMRSAISAFATRAALGAPSRVIQRQFSLASNLQFEKPQYNNRGPRPDRNNRSPNNRAHSRRGNFPAFQSEEVADESTMLKYPHRFPALFNNPTPERQNTINTEIIDPLYEVLQEFLRLFKAGELREGENLEGLLAKYEDPDAARAAIFDLCRTNRSPNLLSPRAIIFSNMYMLFRINEKPYNWSFNRFPSKHADVPKLKYFLKEALGFQEVIAALPQGELDPAAIDTKIEELRAHYTEGTDLSWPAPTHVFNYLLVARLGRPNRRLSDILNLIGKDEAAKRVAMGVARLTQEIEVAENLVDEAPVVEARE